MMFAPVIRKVPSLDFGVGEFLKLGAASHGPLAQIKDRVVVPGMDLYDVTNATFFETTPSNLFINDPKTMSENCTSKILPLLMPNTKMNPSLGC